MKQELTIAVVLLAAGSLLWISSSRPTSQSQQTGDRDQTGSLHSQLGRQDSAMTASEPKFDFSNSVAQASFEQPIISNDSQVSVEAQPSAGLAVNISDLKSPSSDSISFSTTTRYLHPSSDRVSIDLLAQVAKEVASSQPFGLKLSLEANVFDQQVVASGDYYQMGQGSHKTKVELTFDQMPGKPSMLQLCDGRFVYTIHSAGSIQNAAGAADAPEQSLEFVDLLRVKQAAGDITGGGTGAVSPTGWVATGGIASLLQHLASAFNFGSPESLDSNSNRVLIRGGWDEDALRRIVIDFDHELELGSPVQWDRVPRHIPHAVELVLSRSSNQAYFPTQISFLRFGIKDRHATIEPSLLLTFSSPQPLMNLAEGFFVLDSSNLEPTDATDRYIARIESFKQTQPSQSGIEQVAIEPGQATDTSTK